MRVALEVHPALKSRGVLPGEEGKVAFAAAEAVRQEAFTRH